MNEAESRCEPGLILRILKTLMYCRVRNMRLTLVGIGRLLIGTKRQADAEGGSMALESARLAEVLEVLKWLHAKGAVKEKEGFWELSEGASAQCSDRDNDRGKIAAEKIKIAQKAARFLKHIPFIRLVGICGTVATGNARENSDIDFFVITKKGRIWTARVLVMAVLEMLGKRKKPHIFKDRICLNYFVADDEASLEARFKDLYSAYEFAKMIVLIDKDGAHQKFIKANHWIKEYLPELSWWQEEDGSLGAEGELDPVALRRDSDSGLQKALENLLEGTLGDRIEDLLGKMQSGRIERKHEKEEGGEVYWGADALIFHPKPKGKFFAKMYKEMVEGKRGEIRQLLGNLKF